VAPGHPRAGPGHRPATGQAVPSVGLPATRPGRPTAPDHSPTRASVHLPVRPRTAVGRRPVTGQAGPSSSLPATRPRPTAPDRGSSAKVVPGHCSAPMSVGPSHCHKRALPPTCRSVGRPHRAAAGRACPAKGVLSAAAAPAAWRPMARPRVGRRGGSGTRRSPREQWSAVRGHGSPRMQAWRITPPAERPGRRSDVDRQHSGHRTNVTDGRSPTTARGPERRNGLQLRTVAGTRDGRHPRSAPWEQRANST
jgi:hypothetical protein